MLERVIKINYSNLDKVLHKEIELKLIIDAKFFIENPVLDINRLYMNLDKLMRCKEGIESAKIMIGSSQREDGLIDFARKKGHCRRVF